MVKSRCNRWISFPCVLLLALVCLYQGTVIRASKQNGGEQEAQNRNDEERLSDESIFAFFSTLFTTTSFYTPPPTPLSLDTPLTRLHFASCNHQSREQPLWPIMESRGQQMFIWLGDAVYADKLPFSDRAAIFAQQRANPGYASYLSHTPHVIGIYDDHDYGKNDGDRTYEHRAEAKQHFLNFLDEPKDSHRRGPEHEGIYTSYIYGPSGQRTKLILLDTRYNQAPLGSEDDMLGGQQFAWLQREIDASDDINLYILVSGVQFVSSDKTSGEGWRLKPKSRAAVMNAFATRRKNRDAALVILSGDVHLAEADVTYSCTDLNDNIVHTFDNHAYLRNLPRHYRVTPFYDFTSSGLTHTIPPNETTLIFPSLNTPRYSSAEDDDVTQSIRGWYSDLHFGEMSIDWTERRITVEMIGRDGKVHLSYRLPFSSLSPARWSQEISFSFIRRRCELEQNRLRPLERLRPPRDYDPSSPGVIYIFIYIFIFLVTDWRTWIALTVTMWLSWRCKRKLGKRD